MDLKEKKENAKFLSVYMGSIIGTVSAYFLGYAGRVMDVEYKQNFIDSVISAYNHVRSMDFLYNPLNVHSLYGILGGCVIGAGAAFFLINDANRKITDDMETSAGSGGFMSKKDFKKYADEYICKDPEIIVVKNESYKLAPSVSEELARYSSNMIMTDSFCRPIDSRMLIGNNNVLVVGGAGTGKSRFFIKPNLLQMNASYIVTDPSGELINSVGQVLVDHGYKLKVFNISDMQHSNTYNPLRYIRDEAGVNMLISCLIDNTTKGEAGGDNQFFVDAEKLLYSACIFYLKDFCHDETKKNFGGVMDMINASQVDENNANSKSDLDKLFDTLPKNSLAWKYYKAFKQAAGKTLKSIIISCVTRLQPFLTPQVRHLTNQDEMDVEKIGDEKTVLFIITPQADRTYAFLASMLYSQLFETLYFKGEQQLAAGGSEQMNIPVRCLMDEFANVGKVPEFPSRLSTMRKYNISSVIVLQDMAQINSLYGEEEAKTLVGNCSSILFLGSSEINTLKYFSEKLDEKTIRTKSTNITLGNKGNTSQGYNFTGRKVMTASELGEMSSDECIIFTQNMKPFKDKKYRYETHPYYPFTADADKSNSFRYKEYSVFDNNNVPKIKSIIKAKNEIARYKMEKEISNESYLNTKDDPNIVANNIELTEDIEAGFVSMLFANCQKKALRSKDDAVVIIKETDMASKYLFEIAVNIAEFINKDEVIVFGGMESYNDKLIGVGYSRTGKKSRLRQMMDNDLALSLRESGEFKNHIMVAINSVDFKEYKEKVLEIYGKVTEEQ